MSEPTRRCPDVLSEDPVSRMRAEIYQRLMEAQESIAHTLYQRGVSHDVVLAALDSVDERLTDGQRREDLYLSALAHYVIALGGRLEVRARFGDEEILVRQDPDDQTLRPGA
ncbi:MAG: hypothetical protein JWO56_3539 [Acidobacteria bacterium]|nr:hypothetical protein [Acidobacteriota bacterium]